MIVGPSFIRVNQSALRPRKQQEIKIRNEHKDISTKVQNYLASYPYYVPPTASILRDYSNCLLDYFNHSYFTPLSYYDQIQATEQIHLTTSIRKKSKHIILLFVSQIRVTTFTLVQRLNFKIKRETSSPIRMHSWSYPIILFEKYHTKLFDYSTNLRRKNEFYNGNVKQWCPTVLTVN